jgi:hypothetical protein
LDLGQKKGQIAHLDHNPENNGQENLVFLCLDHHSEYDSTTSQHKNYTIHEVKAARQRLYQAIEARPRAPSGQPIEPARGDSETLEDLLEVLPSGGSIGFLRHFSAGDRSFDRENLRDIRIFYYERSGPDHEFLEATLEALRKDLREAIGTFLSTLGLNTWVTEGSRCSVPEEWRYDQPERFRKVVSEIDNAAEAVCTTYDAMIRSARGTLLK